MIFNSSTDDGEQVLLVARISNPALDVGADETEIILTVPMCDDPKGAAWDILAESLGLRPRKEVYFEHLDVDINGDEFFGTDDVEHHIHSFRVWSENDLEEALLDLRFTVFIQHDIEEWRVGLKSPDGIVLLRQLLRDRGLKIDIREDESVLQSRIEQLTHYNKLLETRLNELMNLLTGFQEEKEFKNWHNCPPIPLGWEMVRVFKGWIKRGCFDYTQVEFGLWLIKGRSQKIWQHLINRGKPPALPGRLTKFDNYGNI